MDLVSDLLLRIKSGGAENRTRGSWNRADNRSLKGKYVLIGG
jgi:hypothetical protein